MFYTVKQTAARVGLSEHTVRFYTDAGLIPALARDKNNNRMFDETAINWLIGVKHLRDSGLPLKAVKEYVALCLEGDSTVLVRYQIILRQLEQTRQQRSEAQKRLEYMEKKAALYRDIVAGRVPDSMNPANWTNKSSDCKG